MIAICQTEFLLDRNDWLSVNLVNLIRLTLTYAFDAVTVDAVDAVDAFSFDGSGVVIHLFTVVPLHLHIELSIQSIIEYDVINNWITAGDFLTDKSSGVSWMGDGDDVDDAILHGSIGGVADDESPDLRRGRAYNNNNNNSFIHYLYSIDYYSIN